MEVAAPMTGNFHSDGASSSTALHHYASAPTSPAVVFVPFDWESKPGTPKSHRINGSIANKRVDDEEEEDYMDDDDDYMEFAFQFRGEVVSGGSKAASADEIFEAGKIRPLKPPPRLQQGSSNLGNGENHLFASPKSATTATTSPKSPISRLFRRGRKEVEEFDPFAQAIEETTRGRERERWLRNSVRGSVRATTRSASPPRSDPLTDFAESPTYSSGSNAPKGSGGSTGRKWRLKDFLIFRSASEGRAGGDGGSKDVLGKYCAVSAKMSAHHTTKRAASGLLERVSLGHDVRGLVKGLRSFVRGRS